MNIRIPTQHGMELEVAWDLDTEVTEPRVIPLLNQTVSVTLSKLPQRTL